MGVVMAVSLPGPGRARAGRVPGPRCPRSSGCVAPTASRGAPAAGLVVPGQVALVMVAEDDASAVAVLAGLVAVHEQGGGGAGRFPGDVAGGDDGQVVPGEADQGLGAVGFGAEDGEGAEA